MKRNHFTLIILIMFYCTTTSAQDEITTDSKEKIKKGWTFGAVPAIAYDSDIGFKYGGVVNFYDYGDGTFYPKYKQSIYLEWSRTTKGSGINQFTYDSEYLIPGIRTTAEISYLTEKALDFYGFNGYEAFYNSSFEDDSHPDYISRMFYRMDRNLFRVKADFQGKLPVANLRWLAGFAHYRNAIDTVDIQNLNKGKDEEDLLPGNTGGGLYGRYVAAGLIPEDQADGGNTSLFKLGLVYDTRDNEPNPMRGIWTELQFLKQ